MCARSGPEWSFSFLLEPSREGEACLPALRCDQTRRTAAVRSVKVVVQVSCSLDYNQEEVCVSCDKLVLEFGKLVISIFQILPSNDYFMYLMFSCFILASHTLESLNFFPRVEISCG